MASDGSLAPEGPQQRSRRSAGTAVEVGLTRWRPRGWNTEIEEEDRASHRVFAVVGNSDLYPILMSSCRSILSEKDMI